METVIFQDECRRTHPSFEQEFQIQGRAGWIATLIHAQLGIASEAGEVADAIKKHMIYGKPIDLANINEELGDLLWYVSLACDAIGTTMSDVMQSNIDKLRIRYPEKFTEQDAIERKDKQVSPLKNLDTLRCPMCGSLEHTICEGL